MPNVSIQKAGQLLENVKTAVERLLGRPVEPEEEISIIAAPPQQVPSGAWLSRPFRYIAPEPGKTHIGRGLFPNWRHYRRLRTQRPPPARAGGKRRSSYGVNGREIEFDWDDANIGHVARHNVRPDEAEQVILNDPVDLGMEIVEGEQRYLNLGATIQGRVLLVVTTWREDRVRVVTKRLIQFYYQERGK